MRGQSPKIEMQKLEILRCALKLFSEKGYAGTNMSDIANELGITRTPLYYHYGNKEQLFCEAVAYYADTHVREMRRTFNIEGDVYGKIKHELLALTASEIKANKIFEDILSNQPELKDAYATLNEWDERIIFIKTPFFEEAIEKGELREDVDIKEAISMIFMFFYALNNGNAMRFLDQQGFDKEFIIDAFIDMFKARYGA